MPHAVTRASFTSRTGAGARDAGNVPPARASARSAPRLQRATCACGGGCPRCSAERTATGARPASGHRRLSVGDSHDPLEREADRVATQVMTAQAFDAPHPSRPVIQRAGGTAGTSAADAPDSVHRTLASPGRTLEPELRGTMEQRFGRDFGNVRIHTDAASAQSARDVQALAYTVGSDVVFAAGRYAPGTPDGQRLLAHELTHVVQQADTSGRSGVQRLQRQCNPAWASLPWAQQVTNAKAAAPSAANNQCLADMLDQALTANVTVEEKTNTAPTVQAAAATGRYVEWGTLNDLHVNFDRNLNAKTHNPNQFGEATFITPPGGASISIFIVLGRHALDPVGPQHTEMALHHESSHAWDFLSQWAMIGSTPHGATAAEELKIYTEGFSRYFLELWTIDNTAGSYSFSTDFFGMFSNFPGASTPEQDAAFASVEMFYNVRITGIPCNLMKFKIWLQTMQNQRPASDALVARINALPGLGLTRGTAPSTHFDAALACS